MDVQLRPPPGKVKMIGLVRDATGGIKVDTWETLDPDVRSLICRELLAGSHLSTTVAPDIVAAIQKDLET